MPDYILKTIQKDASYRQLSAALAASNGPVAVFGVPEGHRAVLTAALALERSVLLVTATDADAVRVHGELAAWCPNARLFLPRDLPLVNLQAVSAERRGQRLATLSRLALKLPTTVVSCAAALIEQLTPKAEFLARIVELRPGSVIEPRTLIEKLIASGYERVELIEGPGQCALRGDILDVFPPQSPDPFRVEFFGDEVDQIRVFDVQSQRSVKQELSLLIPPAYETPQSAAAMKRALSKLGDRQGFEVQREDWECGRPSLGADMLLPLFFPETQGLLDYLPDDCALVVIEPVRVFDEARSFELIFSEQVAANLERSLGHPCQARLISPASRLPGDFDSPRCAALYTLFRTAPQLHHKAQTTFTVQPAAQYLYDLNQLAKELSRNRGGRDTTFLYAGEAAERVYEQLSDLGVHCGKTDSLSREPVRGETLIIKETLPRGFRYPELNFTVLTPSELFGKRQSAGVSKKRGSLDYTELAMGDFVVHETHGVGRFMGVVQLTAAGSTRDYLLLEYRGADRLYIPTDQLDRVQKYIGGGEDSSPQLSRLGSSDWGQRVNRAKAAAKKLAVDLARLYSERAGFHGFAYSKDGAWQRKMEDSFPYEETPDQLRSVADIKRDMEKPRPMDRLLCGDVGFGKTEVTLRAAFKAIQDSKQVALLVPTTILAQQHYNTALSRFADFPVRIGCLSRFQQPKERDRVKKALATGELDMVIGTHALLAKSVRFRDLGLLIIDEEHRFGVNHKEQMKELKSDVDVLTLTATPIPRTLNMSLTGVRDISVIDTPPENRYPVQTFVMEYSDSLITTAISRELARGGQAFIVSNRVDGMEGTLSKLAELLPGARIEMGHGQMPETQLEAVMLRFLNHETDVLLCSTIIESGVDIPNANTLVVLEADKLGLAQLYQLRGRVGRSNRMAYAYFTTYKARELSETAQRRLTAIREFTQFGAGYRLAMRDLEIRGAGSLLGADQHGHISDVGYDFYCKLIRQAVAEAKGERSRPELDPALDIAMDAFIPRDFIAGELVRLQVYKRIAQIASRDEYDELTDELCDRFGELPPPMQNLMLLALIKALARNAGIIQLSLEKTRVLLRYDASAQIDGARLLAVLSGEGNARFIASTPPSVELKYKGGSNEEIVAELPQFLQRLSHCILAEDAV